MDFIIYFLINLVSNELEFFKTFKIKKRNKDLGFL